MTREPAARHQVGKATLRRRVASRTGTPVASANRNAGTPIAQGALFGVTSHDPLTYVGSAVVLLLVGVMAATIPARKAARADAASALRHV